MKAASERPELVILDLGLPDMDGSEVLKKVREWSTVPVLVLSVRSAEEDIVGCLDAGADDYLVKPFSPRELVSRVRAILRRTGKSVSAEGNSVSSSSIVPLPAKNDAFLRFPGLTIDLLARRVEVNGYEIALTPTEFDLLALLAKSPDRVFTREVLMSKVWGYDYLGDGHTIDVHISALRKKIETDPDQRYIKTVWRVGYRFEAKTRSVASSS